MELKLGPITRAQMKKLKASNGNEDNSMVAHMEEDLKNKFERSHPTADSRSLPTVTGLIMSTDGHLATQSHQEDVEELKKDKSSATIEQRVGDNLGGFNSPHHQRPFDNVYTCRYRDM
ncbi:hypothetical protein M9H77_23451 [Catharanthus roseus]|uniref:Uncharacterized protein n=1 Tax=Catharanthus roseus TaxID=4058 RepID=A0ACC0AW90_CATRO|nr:hypothetical protein M9H77_23451 [Catharanthus roseus]